MHTPPYPHTAAHRRPTHGLATAAAVLVWVAGLPGPISIFASSFTFGAQASTDTAQRGMVLLGGGLLGLNLGYAVAGTVVLMWIWRAWANAAAAAPQRWSQGWVIGGWFVPVLSLWLPAVILSDIVRASAVGPPAGRLRALVAFWWATWLGGGLALGAAVAGFPYLPMPAGFAWFRAFSGLSVLLLVTAATLFTVLARQLAALQDRQPGMPPAPPAGPAAGRPRRAGVVVAVFAVAVALVTAVTAVLVLSANDDPEDLALAAVRDAGSWSGAHYVGVTTDPNGERVQVDVTITPNGARGTLERSTARAEFVQDGTGLLVKADQQWWYATQPDRAELLADHWVADPGTDVLGIDHILRLLPTALSGELRTGPEVVWTEGPEHLLDGRRAVTLTAGGQQLIVSADEPHELLSIDPRGATSPGEPLRVTPLGGAAATAATEAAGRVRSTESPRTLTQLLLVQPRADVQIDPGPMCTSRTCTATYTVTNTGELHIRGRFQMSVDGGSVGSERVDLRPDQSATFTASADNWLYDSPGATGQMLWEGEIILD